MPPNRLILKGAIYSKKSLCYPQGVMIYSAKCGTVTSSQRGIKKSTRTDSKRKQVKIKILKPLHYSSTRYEEVGSRKGKKK